MLQQFTPIPSQAARLFVEEEEDAGTPLPPPHEEEDLDDTEDALMSSGMMRLGPRMAVARGCSVLLLASAHREGLSWILSRGAGAIGRHML
jgi:hypothetical protein